MERTFRIRRLRPTRALRDAERGSALHARYRKEEGTTAMKQGLEPRIGLAGVLLLAWGGTACVSPSEHQNTKDLAKHYENQVHDLERENERLRQENGKLRGEALNNEASAIEAGFGTDLEARLKEYEQRLAQLDRPIGDTERFDFADGSYLVLVQDAILFDSGSANLSSEGRGKILEIARGIQSAPHGRVWVRGHTDNDPVVKPATLQKFPHGNLELSAARAVEVASLLTSAGNVPRDQVAVAGFGPYEPLKPNDSAANKRLNRRVEIFVAKSE